jgi:hypothetical protein
VPARNLPTLQTKGAYPVPGMQIPPTLQGESTYPAPSRIRLPGTQPYPPTRHPAVSAYLGAAPALHPVRSPGLGERASTNHAALRSVLCAPALRHQPPNFGPSRPATRHAPQGPLPGVAGGPYRRLACLTYLRPLPPRAPRPSRLSRSFLRPAKRLQLLSGPKGEEALARAARVPAW